MKKLNVLTAILICLFGISCASVKGYQKNKINDAEMALGHRKIEKTEISFLFYREGSGGANGGKSGGGCGCN